MDIKVKIVTKDNVDVYDSIKNLLLQLYNGMPEIINVDFNSVLDSSCTEVFIAQYEDKVIATATLVKYK
ncbi:hypothetical protein HN615_04880, partial [Candidatus Woesearchaeota archaeon]|nr:hypothetical protein [Candidatus Woesearchaeota archaeon]